MSLALYRRYRPESFEEVVGQEHVTLPLQQALRNGRINHAYLFSGPRGCGKTTSARILARCLNCEKGPTPTPCGECRSCQELANGGPGSIDVIEIDAASHGGVDDARDLRERAFFAPAASRFKIYIIDEAHMVTSAGFNALLKVVEEPPPHLKFIFATTEPEKVIGTIRSRTHHYPFRLIPPGVLREHLADITGREGIKVEPEVLPLVVRAGAGSARDAMSVMDQLLAGADENGVTYANAASLLGYTDATLLDELVEAFAARDGAAVFRLVDQVVESGHDPRRFLADLLERFRDLVILNAVADPSAARGLIDVPEDQYERMTGQARTFGPAELSRAADLVNTGLTEMRGATAPRLLLELVCARVMLPGADDAERGIAARLDRIERRGFVGAPGGGGGGSGGSGAGGAGGGGMAAGAGGAGVPAAPAPMAPMGGPRVVEDEFDEAPGPTVPPMRAGAGAESPAQPAAQVPQTQQAPQPGQSASGGIAGLGAPPWAADGSGPAGAGVAGLGAPPWAAGDAGAAGAPQSLQSPQSPQNTQSPQHTQNPPSPHTHGGSGSYGDQTHAPAASQQPSAPYAAPSQPPAPAPAPGHSGGHPQSSADVRRVWPDLLEEVKRRDGRVSWMLLSQNAQVIGVDNGRLQVAFVNAGARDRFVSRGTGETLRQAAADLFGAQWQIDALVDPSQTPGTQIAPGVSMPPPPVAPEPTAPSGYGRQAPAAPYQDPGSGGGPVSQNASTQFQAPPSQPAAPHPPAAPTPVDPSVQAAPAAPEPVRPAPAPKPAAQAPAPPPTPTVAPEHDVPSDDDEEVADDGFTAHDLVVRELGGQRLDPDA